MGMKMNFLSMESLIVLASSTVHLIDLPGTLVFNDRSKSSPWRNRYYYGFDGLNCLSIPNCPAALF
jgi:hypothetical protein